MKRDSLHDGEADGLVPLSPIALDQVHTFGDLLRAMSSTAMSGRALGDSLDIILAMARDADCKVVLTVSGAMTVAKQGRIIAEMIDRDLVQAVVATGALIAHGLTESTGHTHYRHDHRRSDQTLYEQGYNRIYDTLEMEQNLNHVEKLVGAVLNDTQPEDGVWSSARFCAAVGQRLCEQGQGPGILASAYQKKTPVFIPAFTDSEVGLDVAIWSVLQQSQRTQSNLNDCTAEQVFTATPSFNPFLDLQQYARLMAGAQRLGILTIGGGVPRNWGQQIGPYVEVTNTRLGLNLPIPRFHYGVRICPEPVHFGGLSGCTYSEGVSWGKFLPPAQGGQFAEVYADATVALPLLMKGVFEELGR